MGVIQSSINQALGTGAILSGLADQSIKQADANKLQKASLEGQIADLDAEIENMKAESQTTIEENPDLSQSPSETTEQYNTRIEENEDLKMASRALKQVENKITAKTTQRKLFDEAISNIGKPLIQRLKGGKK